MDYKENSSEMEESGVKMDIDAQKSHIGGISKSDEVLATNSSNSKLQLKQVPAAAANDERCEYEFEGDEDDSFDNDDDDDGDEIEMKFLTQTMDSKNAGIHRNQNNKIRKNSNNKSPPKKDDDANKSLNRRKTSSALFATPSCNESISPTTPYDVEEKTQSSCLSSPNASTSGSTPPATGDNTPPSDHNTPKHSVQSPPSLKIPSPDNNNGIQQPINVVRNGTIPNAGKPLLSTMSMKLERSAKATRSRKPKSLVAMYESEISENKIGIKLCIKKSETSLKVATAAAMAAVARRINKSGTSSERSRKSSRNVKQRIKLNEDDEADEIDYEPKRKKERNTKRQTASATVVATNVAVEEPREIVEQTVWGLQLPEHLLYKIFQNVVEKEGCLPTLFRLGRVCSLWRRVSLSPTLWRTMDLSTWIKEKYRTELKLKWFVDNRCTCCTELNVSNWKIADIDCFLAKLSEGAPNLTSITLSGWKNFTSDHLTFLVENMKKLERIDLSSINVEMNANKSALGAQYLCNAMQVMGERLTHLYLAHNRLAGIPQLVNILSTHCPNLVILDLSNVTTQATSHGILHVEKLQQGCPKLKVLRITNSHITLSTPSMQEMMDSPGFPELEELSVAVTGESRVIGDEHIQRILKSSSKLKLLDVRGCARLTHESLIRLPAWDIKHLFLSGCSVTRDMGSGLELIASKWAHSLIELDLAWANMQQPLDNALRALADKGAESRLAHLNLCGSSVSEEAVKEVLANCPLMSSINLASCRGLPRGVKRKMQGPQELKELRDVLKVQLKVKLPEAITAQITATATTASSSTSSSTSATATAGTTKSANTNDGGGGGGGSSL